MNEFDGILRNPVSRRAFLARMSAAGLGAAALTLLAGCGGGGNDNNNNGGSPGPGGSVLDPANFPGIPGRSINEVVLNYALTLENLEADLYRQALNFASGRPIEAALDPGVPAPGSTGGYALNVSSGSIPGALAFPAFLYLVQFAYVEAAHRDFLRAAIQSLGGTPTAPSASGYKFAGPLNPDLGSILTNILTLEETGVRAYLGAAGFLTDLNLTQTAVSIYSTEARHSAAVRYVLGLDPGPVPQPGDKRVTPNYPSPNTFEYFLDPPTVIQAIRPFFV